MCRKIPDVLDTGGIIAGNHGGGEKKREGLNGKEDKVRHDGGHINRGKVFRVLQGTPPAKPGMEKENKQIKKVDRVEKGKHTGKTNLVKTQEAIAKLKLWRKVVMTVGRAKSKLMPQK